ncbi:MAG: 23S rRNA (adenine(2503)-C(2))-methyltransferase RlmN [Candidatus Cloacimonadota bacterium]|nr:MAG: 23S rRNA (adenine(2503)-C(2))-methyltransferase RlmN [Candidatus Cloacimonadota bacterium]PIE79026.1 MAG: 23S rRNA (adenine(2503)-C(2))-methyltransferase RlmN [Candidatus Delongbacteria bacterium]
MKKITEYTLNELMDFLISKGAKKFNAKQVWQWFYRKMETNVENMSDLSKKLRAIISSEIDFSPLELHEHHKSSDGTEKFLWKLSDGNLVESVMIPEKERVTVCISSQVGCKFRCDFCTTGKMGFTRNLTAGEIVLQVISMQLRSKRRISNVVYMGMGEPFDNYDNVIKSANILSDDNGLAIGARKITISTVGKVDGIKRYTDEDIRYRLALSLHSPFDDIRSSLMPINNRYSIEEVLDSLALYCKKSKRRVVFEYILIDGVTDRRDDADRLKELLSKLPSKLNLIKFHNSPDSKYRCSSNNRVSNFMKMFNNKDFPVVLRASRGEDIAAACGQLGMEEVKKKGRITIEKI